MIVMERMTMATSFGDIVRQRRLLLGLTQGEFGERVGRDAAQVSKVESGQMFRRTPDAEEFRMWCDAMEMDPAIVLQQMGYIEQNSERKSQPVEFIFAQLADEIQSADQMPIEVQETMLDGLRVARRMYEVKTGRVTKP